VPRRAGPQYVLPPPSAAEPILRVNSPLYTAQLNGSRSRSLRAARDSKRRTLYGNIFYSQVRLLSSITAVLHPVFGSAQPASRHFPFAKTATGLAPGQYPNLPQSRIKFIGRMRAIQVHGKARALTAPVRKTTHSISLRTAPPQIQSFNIGRERNLPLCWRVDRLPAVGF